MNYSPRVLKFLLRRRAFTLYSRTCRRWWARRVEAATLIDCERWSGWSVDGEDGEATHGGNPSRLLPCSRTGGLNWDNRVRGILKSLEFDHAPRCHATAWKTIQREGRGGKGRGGARGGEAEKKKRERERERERFVCMHSNGTNPYCSRACEMWAKKRPPEVGVSVSILWLCPKGHLPHLHHLKLTFAYFWKLGCLSDREATG